MNIIGALRKLLVLGISTLFAASLVISPAHSTSSGTTDSISVVSIAQSDIKLVRKATTITDYLFCYLGIYNCRYIYVINATQLVQKEQENGNLKMVLSGNAYQELWIVKEEDSVQSAVARPSTATGYGYFVDAPYSYYVTYNGPGAGTDVEGTYGFSLSIDDRQHYSDTIRVCVQVTNLASITEYLHSVSLHFYGTSGANFGIQIQPSNPVSISPGSTNFVCSDIPWSIYAEGLEGIAISENWASKSSSERWVYVPVIDLWLSSSTTATEVEWCDSESNLANGCIAECIAGLNVRGCDATNSDLIEGANTLHFQIYPYSSNGWFDAGTYYLDEDDAVGAWTIWELCDSHDDCSSNEFCYNLEDGDAIGTCYTNHCPPNSHVEGHTTCVCDTGYLDCDDSDHTITEGTYAVWAQDKSWDSNGCETRGECCTDADCPSGKPHCVTINGVNTCVECTSDADCASNEYCDTSTYTCKPLNCPANSYASNHKCVCNTGYLDCDDSTHSTTEVTDTNGCETYGECCTDSDCPNDKPRCVTINGQKQCVECTSDADCASNEICQDYQCVTLTCPSHSSPVNHQCVCDTGYLDCDDTTHQTTELDDGNGCETRGECCTNTDCPSDKPYCISINGVKTCVECTPGTYTCMNNTLYKCNDSGQWVKVEVCDPWEQCDANQAACVLLPGRCETNADCTDPSKPYCNEYHWCVECLSDENCPATKPFCIKEGENNWYCTATCSTDEDCQRISNETPFCVNGICVQCATDEHCQQLFDGEKPICDVDRHLCVQCLTDADCVNFGNKTKCHPDYKICVECLSDEDCPTGTFCDTVKGICVSGCRTDQDCPEDKPRCYIPSGQTIGTCVECLSNEDCPTGYYCDLTTHTCVQLGGGQGGRKITLTGCKSDADCSEPTPHCYIPPGATTGFCVECYMDEHCPAGYYCNLDTFRCEPATGQSVVDQVLRYIKRLGPIEAVLLVLTIALGAYALIISTRKEKT